MRTRISTQAIVVLTTAASRRDAAAIARTLVDERLAACVNVIGPIRSVYRWRGAVEDDAEFLLAIKTRADRYPDVERRVQELHSYENPELIAIAVERGAPRYLEWLLESVRPAKAKK
ncbi:MAG: divalent-cation tolerance protein CutA [Candidatus Binataceae bacterium]